MRPRRPCHVCLGVCSERERERERFTLRALYSNAVHEKYSERDCAPRRMRERDDRVDGRPCHDTLAVCIREEVALMDGQMYEDEWPLLIHMLCPRVNE